MRNIVINTYPLETSGSTIKYGAGLARRLGLGIKLMHVIDTKYVGWYPPHAGYGMYPQDITYAEMLEKEREVEEKKLDEFIKSKFEKVADIAYPVYKVEVSSTHVSLVDESDKEDTNFLVLNNANDNSEFEKTNLQYVVEEAKCPVLLIPEGYQYQEINNIVYAAKHNDEKDLPSIQTVAELASKYNAQLNIIHVGDDLNTGADKDDSEKKVFGEIKKKVSYKDTHFHVINSNYTTNSILEYSYNHHADLIVLLQREKGLLRSLFSKDHTQKAIQRSKLPLLILHESGKGAENKSNVNQKENNYA